MSAHNRVYESEDGVTSTPFERACDAYAASIMAAAYPSDTNARMIAIQACEKMEPGINYIDAVARAFEALAENHEAGKPPVTVDTARFYIVGELAQYVGRMLDQGAETREGILSNGREADAMGFGEDRDPDDYGSLA